MKRHERINRAPAIIGYTLFLMLSTLVIVPAIFIYRKASIILGGSSIVVSLTLIGLILLVSALFLLAEAIRRKLTINKRVNKLLDATNKVAKGDFSIKIEPKHKSKYYDEIDLITENFNKMVKELSNNEILKNDFISNVSHELKTPIAVISNYVTLLQDEHLEQEKKLEYAKIIKKTTLKLNDLVSNILKLNKLENHTIEIDIKSTKIDEILIDSIIKYEDLIENKNIELITNIEEIKLDTNPTYIEIICNNLISNAIKFTDNNKKIVISLTSNEKEIIFSVKDEGCGIEKEQIDKIFDKFYQVDSSHSIEGNGLGLALVKKVVDLIGGNIEVESKINEGSTFSIYLHKQ